MSEKTSYIHAAIVKANASEAMQHILNAETTELYECMVEVSS